jgi:3-oxoacyl-[acyl-carrier protein] reductase
MNLQGKNILITGGSSGIGKATAIELIKHGAKVAITGRDENKLNEVAKAIGAFPIHADVSKEADVEKTYDVFLKEFGSLDVLINNAGIGGKRLLLDEVDLSLMRQIYDVNVFGVVMMAQKAAQLFKKQNYGDMVNIASTAALNGYEGGTMYSSSKFALRGLTISWQIELRKHNVRIFLINPSYVATAFAEPSRTERAEEPNKLSSKEIAHSILSALQMDRRGYIPELTVHATNPF